VQLLPPWLAATGTAGWLVMWSDRLRGCQDRVPAANVAAGPIGALEPSPLRRFARSRLTQPPQQPGHGPGDDDLDGLRAGEATSAVLLAATRLGLATTPLSQALEVSSHPTTTRDCQASLLADLSGNRG
jgi:nitroreductase